jgi:rhodanese-related sulfurtransferase
MSNIPSVSIRPADLDRLRQSGQKIDLIDVRTPAEFREVHIDFARNVPLDRLDPTALSADAPVYLVCRSGGRGRQACEKLAAAGLAQVVNVEGGTLAWEVAGLPLVRGQKTISLERQVRIVAGSFVLLGAALAFLFHPYWIAVSAFFGAGLIFAGLTDTCGMGMLLARMPWNQVAQNSSCCATSPVAKH